MPTGKTAAVTFTKTILSGSKPLTTKTNIYLTYVYKPGDNGDGDIDNTDAALYLKHLSGTQIFTPDQLARADVNGDNAYDILDAVAILKK